MLIQLTTPSFQGIARMSEFHQVIRLPSFATVEKAEAFAAKCGGTLKLEPQRDADGRVRGIVVVESEK